MVKLWVVKDSQKDINGGFLIAAPDRETALKVFVNMFGYDRVIVQEFRIH